MKTDILTSLMHRVYDGKGRRNYEETVFLLGEAKNELSRDEAIKSVVGELLTKLQKHIPTFFDRDTLDDLLSRYKNLELIKKNEEREQEGEVAIDAPLPVGRSVGESEDVEMEEEGESEDVEMVDEGEVRTVARAPVLIERVEIGEDVDTDIEEEEGDEELLLYDTSELYEIKRREEAMGHGVDELIVAMDSDVLRRQDSD